MLMVDLFAYMGDVVLYYQDRIASELFPRTASERNGIVDLLRLIGYELYPAAPAMADLTLTFRCPEAPRTVTLHYGDRFTTRPQDGAPVEFTYLGPELELALLSDQMRSSTDPDAGPLVHYDGLPVEQSRLTDPAVVIGSSTGEPGQSFALPHERVVTSSVVVEINEGANWVAWERKDALLFDTTEGVPVVPSDPEARHYRLLTDGSGTVHVVFGSARPPRTGTDNVRATYRVCQGSAGNVVAGTISQAATEIAELHRVTNPRPRPAAVTPSGRTMPSKTPRSPSGRLAERSRSRTSPPSPTAPAGSPRRVRTAPHGTVSTSTLHRPVTSGAPSRKPSGSA